MRSILSGSRVLGAGGLGPELVSPHPFLFLAHRGPNGLPEHLSETLQTDGEGL